MPNPVTISPPTVGQVLKVATATALAEWTDETTATTSAAGIGELATDAEAKVQTATRLLVASNLRQGAPVVAGTLAAGFVQHYQTAPTAASATAVHADVTLTTSTQSVTTAITSPDIPRVVTITGNASGMAGDVVITGTNIAGAAITDTIALSGTAEVAGVKAFATVVGIDLPVRTHVGDTVSVGVANVLGLPHIVDYAALLLVKLFGGSTDAGSLAVDDDEIEKNLYALAGTADGSTLLDLYYIV